MDDKTALAFNTICNFIRDLNASFGTKQKSLMLYGHLIEKTGLIHIEPVKKHIQIFRTFVELNEDAIEKRNRRLLKNPKIMYSERVSIDLSAIFQSCDRDEESVIWNHLLTISAVLHPQGKAKQVLKDIKQQARSGAGGGANEENFLKNIIDKIGNEITSHNGEEEVNPMQMIGSMMSSGVLNDVFQSLSSGLNDGNLDLGKMMSSMQGLMTNLNTMVGETEMKTMSSSAVPAATTTTSSSSVSQVPSTAAIDSAVAELVAQDTNVVEDTSPSIEPITTTTED